MAPGSAKTFVRPLLSYSPKKQDVTRGSAFLFILLFWIRREASSYGSIKKYKYIAYIVLAPGLAAGVAGGGDQESFLHKVFWRKSATKRCSLNELGGLRIGNSNR